MQQEAPQEFVDRQRHQSFLVAVSGIAPAEGGFAVFESNESVVGNRHAMGVGAEVAKRVFGTAEGALGVYDPVVAKQYPQPGAKGVRFGKIQQSAVELEFASMKGGFQPGDELPAEDAAEHRDG